MSSPTLPAKLTKSQIPEVYRGKAAVYDVWGKLTESKAQDRCLDLANIQDGEAILEVAVGTGLSFQRVLRQNPSGINEGIDLSPAMLAKAKEKALKTGVTNYNLQMGDAYQLDYPDASFDLLINNYMFDLLPKSDFQSILQEFYRVLRPGGRLVLLNMTKGERWYQQVWNAIYRIQPSWIGGCRGVALLDHVHTVGFQQVHREFISQMAFPSEVIYGVK
ncbi:MAG: methyltransferase domain-containing protein [Chloroflexi bacterium]|nr:MAG: methyltransferase domain-containing protein [Chloroflexota bacterium]